MSSYSQWANSVTPHSITKEFLTLVSEVGLNLPIEFNIITPIITSSGTLTAEWADVAAKNVLCGPTSGSPDAPTFKQIDSNFMSDATLIGKSFFSLPDISSVTLFPVVSPGNFVALLTAEELKAELGL